MKKIRTSYKNNNFTEIHFRNIIIRTREDLYARKAIILAHGGYTPWRNVFQTGSGKVTIPAPLTLRFSANANDINTYDDINLHADPYLMGQIIPYRDHRDPGEPIENYALGHLDIGKTFVPTKYSDVILVKPQSRAHLKDVFDAFNFVVGRKWLFIHCFSCRVNRLIVDQDHLGRR